MIDDPLVRPAPASSPPSSHASPGPRPGARTTELGGVAFAAASAVVSMLATQDDELRAQALDYVFWLAIAYLASRTVVKVAHEIAARR